MSSPAELMPEAGNELYLLHQVTVIDTATVGRIAKRFAISMPECGEASAAYRQQEPLHPGCTLARPRRRMPYRAGSWYLGVLNHYASTGVPPHRDTGAPLPLEEGIGKA